MVAQAAGRLHHRLQPNSIGVEQQQVIQLLAPDGGSAKSGYHCPPACCLPIMPQAGGQAFPKSDHAPTKLDEQFAPLISKRQAVLGFESMNHAGRRTKTFQAIAIGLVMAILLLVACGHSESADPTPTPTQSATAQPELVDLEGVADLQARFNEASGSTRMILLFSPT